MYSSSLLLSLYDSTIGYSQWYVYHVLARPLIGYCINLVTQPRGVRMSWEQSSTVTQHSGNQLS
jgi:uncharacterized membrane protein